ncbi:MAG: hypothetical protein ABSD57_06115 [Verrucomicrobiota bacterium]|jgi:hypothetical protein
MLARCESKFNAPKYHKGGCGERPREPNSKPRHRHPACLHFPILPRLPRRTLGPLNLADLSVRGFGDWRFFGFACGILTAVRFGGLLGDILRFSIAVFPAEVDLDYTLAARRALHVCGFAAVVRCDFRSPSYFHSERKMTPNQIGQANPERWVMGYQIVKVGKGSL